MLRLQIEAAQCGVEHHALRGTVILVAQARQCRQIDIAIGVDGVAADADGLQVLRPSDETAVAEVYELHDAMRGDAVDDDVEEQELRLRILQRSGWGRLRLQAQARSD